MANIKSAKKRISTNKRQKGENKYVKATIATMTKNFNKLVAEGKLDQATKYLTETIAYVNSACSKGILHKNNAARKVARLSAHLDAAKKAKAPKAERVEKPAPKAELKKEAKVEAKAEPAKKVATKKAPAKKAEAKPAKEEKKAEKAPAKATAKKAPAKKAEPKKAEEKPAKKPAAKKATTKKATK